MLKRQYNVLKADGLNIINIEDIKIGGKEFPLVEPTIAYAKERGFELVKRDQFSLQPRTYIDENGEKKVEFATESVLIFKKPPVDNSVLT